MEYNSTQIGNYTQTVIKNEQNVKSKLVPSRSVEQTGLKYQK